MQGRRERGRRGLAGSHWRAEALFGSAGTTEFLSPFFLKKKRVSLPDSYENECELQCQYLCVPIRHTIDGYQACQAATAGRRSPSARRVTPHSLTLAPHEPAALRIASAAETGRGQRHFHFGSQSRPCRPPAPGHDASEAPAAASAVKGSQKWQHRSARTSLSPWPDAPSHSLQP